MIAWLFALKKFFQVKEVKDAKVEEKKKEEEVEGEKTVKMVVDSGKDVVDLVPFSDIILVLMILAIAIIILFIVESLFA